MHHIDPLPEGAQPLIPHMVFDDCAKAMDFYKKVFMAEEVMRMKMPDGKKIAHAEMRISGCMIYMADECEQMGAVSPKRHKGHSISMALYCLDADKVFNRCVKNGCKVIKPMENAFWGDRYGSIEDPFGHQWTLMQRVEVLSPQEIHKRGQKAMAAAR